MKKRIEFLCNKLSKRLNEEIVKDIENRFEDGKFEAINETLTNLKIRLKSAKEAYNKIPDKKLYPIDVIKLQSKIDTLKELINYFENEEADEI